MVEQDDKWVASLKVPELKEELKKRGLSTDGKKADLAGRLKDALQADAPADGDQDGQDDHAAAEEPPAAAAAATDAPPDQSVPEDDPPEEVNPASLTVAALREELEKRGLLTAGKKAELVARLTEAQATAPAAGKAAEDAPDADGADDADAAAGDGGTADEPAEADTGAAVEVPADEQGAPEAAAAADGDAAPADGADADPAKNEPALVDAGSMTVAQLREQLTARGQPTHGRKADLVARLTAALEAADGATDEATETPAAADEMPPAAAAEPEAETIVEDPDAKAEEPVDAAADAEPEADAAHKTAAVEEAQLEQPAIAGDQHNTPDEVTAAADMEEAEAADEGAAVERDAEMAASEPADEAAGGEDPIVEEEAVAAGDAEAAPEQEEEPAPPMEEPMPAADTVKTAHAAAGPVAAAPSAGAEAMDAEDGVELDFEEAEEPDAAPEQQARKRPHSPVSARKAGDGEHMPAKLQKMESGGKAELRQPSGLRTARRLSPSIVAGSAPRQPCPEPNMEPTCALLIEGFTRPFTKSQVDALLSQHGRVEAMWMPTIKNLAYVIYETADVAEDTRQSLYSLQWPKDSPKRLMPKFVPVEEAQAACTDKALPGSAEAAPAAPAAAPPSKPVQAAAPAAEALKQHPGDARALLTERRNASQKEKAVEAQAPAVVDEPEELLDLDAIFRKTTAEPPLYWLPLTEEEAVARAAAKSKPFTEAAGSAKIPQLNGSVTDTKMHQ